MRKILLAVLILCPGWTAFGVTANTIITGTIAGPNGSNPSGTMVISWQRSQNDAVPRQTIAQGRTSPITITNGVIPNVSLFPNTVMLPAGTCYQVDLTLRGLNSRVYWTVPVSSTPLDVGLVQGNIPCATQPGPTISLGNISNSGATTGQVPIWNGFYWAPGNGGGGGGGNPGGISGQIQYNNSGAFGGFNLAGDCSISVPNILCTKTNGVSFAASATINTTNAANISSGILAPARGGTGASGPFSQGSVLFVGGSGVYGQDNSNFFWDATNRRLGIGTNTPSVTLDVRGPSRIQGTSSTTVPQATFGDLAGAYLGVGQSGASYGWIQSFGSGQLAINPLQSDVIIGGAVDHGYRLDIQGNGTNGTATFHVAAASTTVSIQAGSTQGGDDLLQFKDSSGNTIAEVLHDGQFVSAGGGNVGSALNGNIANGLNLSGTKGIAWSSDTTWFGAPDVGFVRNAAGQIGINDGSNGSSNWRDLILRTATLTGSGFTGGGTANLCVDNSGNLTTAGCPGGGGGGGTVTNTGALTAGRLILGNSGNDITALGTLGTATTLLHGNAGGNPTFSAVSLTTDVTGVLPFANGGTGLNTNFTNHFFYGNNSGGAAAPIAVQPTWADLAAGSALTRATFPGGDLFIGGVNPQTGTTYAMLTTDENKITTFNNGSAVAVSLSQATTTGFTNGAVFHIYNIGAGAVTITPATSTINGSATAVLNQGQGAIIVSDGTNYSAWISAAPTGSGTVTSVATTGPITGGTITATGTIGCATCVTSAAALTSNQLVLGGGLQASATLGSLGTTTTVLHGNAGGAPSFAAITLTTDVTGLLPLANGGLAANITASNGGIFYSTGAAGALLAGTATARQMLQSGASTTPAWSTTTWPATTTINRILYSSAASVIGEIATANGGILNAGATGIPAMTVTPVFGVAGTSTGTIGLSGVTSGVVTIQPASAAGTWTMTLPTSGGTNGYVLSTNGSGVTSWVAASAGSGTVTVVGAGSLTSTALVTGGGSQTLQTPSATATMDSSGNISTPGTMTIGAGGSGAGTILLSPVAVSGLPTCNGGAEGTHASVNDANATTFLSTVAGGGSNKVPVYCNGTNWLIG